MIFHIVPFVLGTKQKSTFIEINQVLPITCNHHSRPSKMAKTMGLGTCGFTCKYVPSIIIRKGIFLDLLMEGSISLSVLGWFLMFLVYE